MGFLASLLETFRPQAVEARALAAFRYRRPIVLKMTQTYAVACALERALIGHGIDRKQAFQQAVHSMAITCPQCGAFDEDGRAICISSGMEHPKNVTFGGPNVASLYSGRCPLCKGKKVSVTLDPLTGYLLFGSQ